MVHRAYSPAGYVLFGPGGPFGGAYAVAPRGFAPGYGPAALQAALLYPAGLWSGAPAWHLICP